MKKLLKVGMGLGLLSLGLVGCSEANEDFYYVSLRINPEIELVCDNQEEVVAVNAINSDGETVLSEVDLIGLTASEAGETFTQQALDLGYIDPESEDVEVYILTEGEDESSTTEIKENIKKNINSFFNKNGIFGRVSEEDLEELTVLAQEWNVSLKDARIIDRILELYPEMTLEEILEMSNKDRINLIKDEVKNHGLVEDLRDEYKDKVDVLKEEFDEFFNLKNELKELEEKLNDEALTEEEKLELQALYDSKKEEYEALKIEYKEQLETIKEQMKNDVSKAKEDHKKMAEERRSMFGQKAKEHLEKVNENKEEIENKIKEWQNKFNK